MIFILIHGAFGSPEGNWFPELREKLEDLGQTVIVPKFPVEHWEEFTKKGLKVPPTKQSLQSWLEIFRKEVLPKIEKGKKLCFICHSLAPVFILHVVDKYNLQLDSAIFVSPFMDKLNLKDLWQFDHANSTFYKTDFDFDKLKKLIPISYVLYSSDDPYVNKTHSILFAKALDSSLIYVTRAGHMNSEVNLNEFPLVFDLCNTRMDLSIYQRYLAHRREIYSMEYVAKKPEATITLKPSEIMDEGVFHFKYLKNEGFCTFLSWIPNWNPFDRYYTDGRRSAKRVKNFTRVILIRDITDLNREILIKQINLDMEAGIQIYLCMLKDIKGKIGELDFGIWDGDYLCIIKYSDKWEQMKEIELDSRSKQLQKAVAWKSIVMKNATRIYNTATDIKKYIKNNS